MSYTMVPLHDAPNFMALGAKLLICSRYDEALRCFEEVLARWPNSSAAHHGRGRALYGLQKRDCAISALRIAVKYNPDAWSSWTSIARISPREDERLNAIGEAANALERICQRTPPDIAQFHRCVRAFIDARRYAEAIEFIGTHEHRFSDRTPAEDLLALTHYRQGSFPSAFYHKQNALLTVCPSDCSNEPPNRIFSPEAAIDALAHVWDVLKDGGANCFLAAGTLLGFYRDGHPLPTDRDVDIGVITSPADAPSVADILRRHPNVILRPEARRGDRYFALSYAGTAVDVFLYEPHEDRLLCGMSYHPGDIQWRHSAFGLASASYAGRTWTIPDAPERYLEETYGINWHHPDSGFASAISSPSLFQVLPETRAFYAAARAKAHLISGNREKAHQLVAQSPLNIRLPTIMETSGWHP